ncbi:MAG: sigma-70 region 4 domain-containing protein, partial [Myxococcota bacterium]
PPPPHERLERALQRLDAEDRTLLTATALDGRSLAAVSSELGLSLAAVKSRAFRARRRLSRGFARA